MNFKSESEPTIRTDKSGQVKTDHPLNESIGVTLDGLLPKVFVSKPKNKLRGLWDVLQNINRKIYKHPTKTFCGQAADVCVRFHKMTELKVCNS